MRKCRIQKEESVLALSPRIRLVIFDFDGVFTDNTVYIFKNGKEAMRCCRSDGIGLELLKKKNIISLVISSEINSVVRQRCSKLKIDCISGCGNKLRAMKEQAKKLKLSLKEIAYVGNDINDAPCLSCVGLPIVVSDGHTYVKKLAKYITRAKGGHGAVREVCDLLINSRADRKKGIYYAK